MKNLPLVVVAHNLDYGRGFDAFWGVVFAWNFGHKHHIERVSDQCESTYVIPNAYKIRKKTCLQLGIRKIVEKIKKISWKEHWEGMNQHMWFQMLHSSLVSYLAEVKNLKNEPIHSDYVLS